MRPLSIGELLDAAIKIVRRQAGQLYRIVLYVVVPVQVLAIVVAAATASDSSTTTSTSVFDGRTTTTTQSAGSVTATLVVGILSSIATLIATAAMVKAISDTWVGKQPDWRESLREARRRTLALIWLVIVVAVVVGLGFVALIIPGIWLLVPCALAFPALMVEGCKGFKAIGRGRRLVKGRWFSTAGAIFLGYFLASILGFMLGALVGAVFLTQGDSSGFAVGNAIASSIATVATVPFNAAIITLAYYDLRVRKEGFDLELLAQGLGSQVAADQSFFQPGSRQGAQPSAEPPFWPPPPDWQPPPGWTPSPPRG
jgi:MFS family permease